MVTTGNPYLSRGKFKFKTSRIPPEIDAKAAEMLIQHESVHQVRRSTGLSKPYITKMRDRMKEEGKIKAN